MSVATKDEEDQEQEVEPPKPNRAATFLQHAIIYGLGTVSVQLVSIVLMPLYTNNLTTAEYGVLTTLYRIGDVLNICLMMNGIRQASLNFWCKAESEESKIRLPSTVAVFTFCILVAGAGLAFGGSFAFADVLDKQFDLKSPLLIACGVTAMLMQAFTIMPLALMQARMESKWYVITSLSILACQLSLVIFAVLVLGWGVWGVVAALMVTYGFFGALLTARELWGTSIKPDIAQFWKIVQFSAPFVPSGLCFFVLHNGDHFFLLKYYGAALAGVYGLGYRIAKGVVMLSFQPFMQVWGAWMYDVAKKSGRELAFGQMYTRIVAVCIMAGLGIVVFQAEALYVLSTPAFAGASDVIPPLVFAHFFLILAYLMDSVYYVERRTDLKPWVAAATTIVMLVAYYVMIPRYGTLGAAWATFIGFAFHCGFNAIVASKIIAVRYEIGRLATLFAIAAGLYLASTKFGLGAMPFVIKSCLFAVYPIAIWFLVANQEEKHFAFRGIDRGLTWWRGSKESI